MNAKQAQQLQSALDKALGKVGVLLSKAQHNADPGRNAELMHSLQAALLDLEKAQGLVSEAKGMAQEVCAELVYALKSAEDVSGERVA